MKTFRSPVIVGAAQFAQAKDEPKPLDPIGLMKKTGAMALADTGAAQMKQAVDKVMVINILSWSYADAPGLLADSLEIAHADLWYSAVGGVGPQVAVNQAALDIATGKNNAILIAGAEASTADRRSQKGQVTLDWPARESPGAMEGEIREGSSDTEVQYGLFAPLYNYALLENALRASLGRTLDEHTLATGRICERLNKVAGNNPLAVSPTPFTAKEITTPATGNRMVSFPYTLRMSTNPYVDQSAALVMTSEETAEKMGIPRSQWVHVMGGCNLNNIWTMTQRPTLVENPALEKAGDLALKQAGLTLGQINAFDLYSCFPSSVGLAFDALGISQDDPREITLTGGLPYFGGPGNNYSTHAICEAVDAIRKEPGKNIMVVCPGWYNTKWSVGIYGSSPGAHPWEARDLSDIQKQIDSRALPPPVEKAHGSLTVEAYTIWHHHKSGKPQQGMAIGRLDDGSRALAFIDAAPDALLALEKIELAGKTGPVRFDEEKNRNLVYLDPEALRIKD